MSIKKKTDTVLFTTKGQVVIPAWLRKEFEIVPGSKAIVEATCDGILLKPVTRHAIAKLYGILTRKPNQKPLAAEWAEHKRAEKELDERRHARNGS